MIHFSPPSRQERQGFDSVKLRKIVCDSFDEKILNLAFFASWQ
jgi:hypothetical protein